MTRTLAIVAVWVTAAVSAIPVLAEPTRIWKLELDRPGRWFKTSPAGVCLVGTDSEILGVAPDSGKVLWRIGPIKDLNADDIQLIADQPVAILQVGVRDSVGLSVIDLRDGHILRIQHEGLLRSLGSFVVPETNDLLVLATTSRDGSKRTALRVDMASGVPTWTSRTLCDGFEPVLVFTSGSSAVRARQVPFNDTDSSMIFHMLDGTFRRFDLNTGALVWSARGKHARKYLSPAAWETHPLTPVVEYNTKTNQLETDYFPEEPREFELQFAPMLSSSNGARFYAPYRNSVGAFASATGASLWPDPPELQGSVAQMQETPAGLLVRTVDVSDRKEVRHRVLLLDAGTGAVRWRWPKSGGVWRSLYKSGHWLDASNFILENDRVVIAAEGNLRTADLSQGLEQTLGKLEFENSDHPRALLSGPDDYAVIGGCNLGIYAKTDGRRSQKYYREPPFDYGWGLALLALSAATRGWIEPQLGLELLELRPDLSESTRREGYVYFLARMYAGEPERSGVVRVRLETGEVDGEIDLGTKKPSYRIDSDGRLYIWSSLNTIQCYRF